MISFFSSTLKLPDYSLLQTDIHSHVLPGIDDGAKDVAESIELLRGLKNMGFEHCIATPHISQEHYQNTPQTIKAAHNCLTSALEASPLLDVAGVAAEYLLDEYFLPKINKRELLTLPGDRVLFELSFASPPHNLEEVIFALRVEGYRPLLAHPERYRYWARHQEKWTQMISLGCELQLNILSLLGYYGKTVRKTAYEILEHHPVSFLGTDCHNDKQLKALQAGLKDRQFAKVLNKFHFDNSKLALL